MDAMLLSLAPWLPPLDLLLLGVIPLVAALIGWLTNMVAIKMTFYPVEFRGIWPLLGWQGIIPRHSDKIGQKTVDLVTSRLVPAEEVLSRVDPRRLAAELEPIYRSLSAGIVEEVIRAQSGLLWELLPDVVRRRIYHEVEERIPEMFDRIFREYQEHLDELFDLRGLVLDSLTGKNKRLLNELFMRAGSAEFAFIVRCGIYFGFVLGCLQAVLWYLVPAWWLLPVAGVVVGYVTNWLAIQMIFRPLRPKRYLLFTYQGLFLKRQAEVAREYANLLANEVIIPSKIIQSLVEGERAGLFIDTIQRQLEAILTDTPLPRALKSVVLLTVKTEPYRKMREIVTRRFVEMLPEHIHRMEDYWREAMDLEETIFERLTELPPEEFEDVLRACFREDEAILIAVGAALGLVAGLLQLAALL